MPPLKDKLRRIDTLLKELPKMNDSQTQRVLGDLSKRHYLTGEDSETPVDAEVTVLHKYLRRENMLLAEPR